MSSDNGRWITLIIKQDNAIFVICNIYGFNSHASNKSLFTEKVSNLKELQKKYQGSYIILWGDFNECPDDSIDRYPPKLNQPLQNTNLISMRCFSLTLTDAWRLFNPNAKQFTWCNRTLSLKSRINLFLISSSFLQYVKDIIHLYAPLSDHRQIILKLATTKESSSMRGYWKFNNSRLNHFL